jgi:SPX domain protein involved in polyphosphate accumulation
MKFGKNLLRVIELSDAEWGPYWMDYKLLKKKINEIVEETNKANNIDGITDTSSDSSSRNIANNKSEVEFFRLLRKELKKTSDFYSSAEDIYKIREKRVWTGMDMLKEEGKKVDKETWTRFLMACLKFYKDVLLLENFAIMNYCAFSKILKKHDKLTGYNTRDAFMRNVMNLQNFTNYTYVMELVKKSEKLFEDVEALKLKFQIPSVEEKLFIDAIRNLNSQAQELLTEEKSSINDEDNEYQNNDTFFNISSHNSIASSPNLVNAIGWIHSIHDGKNNEDSNDDDDNNKISRKRKSS